MGRETVRGIRARMAGTSGQQQLRGFLIGALVSGAIAAGFLLSRPSAPGPVVNAPPPPPPPAAMPVAPSTPLLTPAPAPATPRDAADALFNEAMMASEANDGEALMQVLPRALGAYRALGALDDDGVYHVAVLELAGARYSEARATAATLLAKNPRHLLALAVSMRAAGRAGDAAAARDFAKRLLEAYDAESTRPLPEYQDHARVLPGYRAEAQAAAQ